MGKTRVLRKVSKEKAEKMKKECEEEGWEVKIEPDAKHPGTFVVTATKQ